MWAVLAAPLLISGSAGTPSVIFSGHIQCTTRNKNTSVWWCFLFARLRTLQKQRQLRRLAQQSSNPNNCWAAYGSGWGGLMLPCKQTCTMCPSDSMPADRKSRKRCLEKKGPSRFWVFSFDFMGECGPMQRGAYEIFLWPVGFIAPVHSHSGEVVFCRCWTWRMRPWPPTAMRRSLR